MCEQLVATLVQPLRQYTSAVRSIGATPTALPERELR
jgi:hypothetical protein